MKKLMRGVLLSTILVSGQVYALEQIPFQAHEKKDFYCVVTGATPTDEGVFMTRNVDVQGFPCESRERGKLKMKAVEMNQYYFKGQGTDKPGSVILMPYQAFNIKCFSGSGENRVEYKPGGRYCPPSSAK